MKMTSIEALDADIKETSSRLFIGSETTIRFESRQRAAITIKTIGEQQCVYAYYFYTPGLVAKIIKRGADERQRKQYGYKFSVENLYDTYIVRCARPRDPIADEDTNLQNHVSFLLEGKTTEIKMYDFESGNPLFDANTISEVVGISEKSAVSYELYEERFPIIKGSLNRNPEARGIYEGSTDTIQTIDGIKKAMGDNQFIEDKEKIVFTTGNGNLPLLTIHLKEFTIY